MKKTKLILVILIIIQTILYVIVGLNKEYLHIDEAYSYGLSNYERINIQDNTDFFDNWHTKEYYEDYLVVNEDEKNDYTPVYENQKNDVHPPLYYLILRFAMELDRGHFSKWTGIIVNIVIYAFITIFMYLILSRLLKNEKNSEIKSSLLAFISSITLASLSNVVYIRMYALLTLDILITIFLHIKLIENKEIKPKLLIAIGITTLMGILTHYYYLFFISFMYLTFLVKYIRQKNYKNLIYYTLTLIITGIISLIIFPYSITHMFFGYRGQSVISKLNNIPDMINGLFTQVYNLNYYGFNNILIIVIVIIVGTLLYRRIKKIKVNIFDKETKEKLQIIFIPTILFFMITALASPWNVLRYIVPACGITFTITIFIMYKTIKSVTSENVSNIIVSIILIITLISPIVLKMKPELLYKEKKGIIEKISTELNLPTIYLFDTTKGNNFIDEIILFAKINQSYIAKDLDISEENIQEIFKNKDVSKGIVVFINDQDEKNNENKLEAIKTALKLQNEELVQNLTSCKIYYIN